ncbi:hypothetical protein KO498_12525 [Lentibacter algarum]|uniref:hypothetical protein n=1 Tax=Lentibacter algarum TaxID=576131 RepID=UPI001C088985|nr:hypothetical protein [Lentibacter algarum]MBU2982635.1 hypothetical protein [Lentibacter algarum]
MHDLQAIPILLTPDPAATEAFGKQAGFDVEVFGDNHLIFRGHSIELHYSFTTRPDVCSETSCYIRGVDILQIFETLKASGIANLSEIVTRPWGMAEFYLHDPHGNLLKFGMSTDELPEPH